MSEARRHPISSLVLVALVAVLVHAGSLRGAFLEWDDALLVYENPPVVEGGLSDVGDLLAPSVDRAHYGFEYLPVRDLSNRLDRALFDLNPVGYHLGNVLLFGLAAAALLAVFLALTGDRRVALLGALLFAVHPVATESVACIAHRKDVLMAALLLTAWLAWMKDRRLLSLLLFVGAVFSKLPAVVLPGLLVLGDLVLGCRFDRRRIGWMGGFVLVAAFAMGIGMSIAPALDRAGWHGGTFATNLLSAGAAFLEGGRLLLAPVGLHVGRVNEGLIRTAPDAASVLGLTLLVILAGVGVAALIRLRRARTPGLRITVLGALGLLIVQAPYLQIRPFWVLFAERYLILALVPFCLVAAHLMLRLAPRARPGIVLAVVLLLAVSTVHRETRWRDTDVLFCDAIAKEPGSYIALDKVARLRMDQRRFEEARDLCRRAIAAAERVRPIGGDLLEKILPNSRLELINAHMALGDWPGARRDALAFAQGWPDSWMARFFVGLVTHRSVGPDEAEPHYLHAIEMAGRVGEVAAMAHFNLSLIYRERDGAASARVLSELEKAVRGDARITDAWAELARAHAESGRWKDAAGALRGAERSDPENPEWPVRLAAILEERLLRPEEAAEARRRAAGLRRR